MVDLLQYLRGDGRSYYVSNNWGAGPELMQTQTDGNVFYHVKNNQWEELWADDVFIYRGTDTSGTTEIYTLTESGRYGSRWMNRHATLNQAFRRAPTVTWRRKSDGAAIPGKPPAEHVTWLRLVTIHAQLTFPGGVKVNDVAELHGYVDAGGRAASQPFEKYFYGAGFGLIAWEDPATGNRSWITQVFAQGEVPSMQRERIAWLNTSNRLMVDPLPAVKAFGEFKITKLPGTFINVRGYPALVAEDVGDLRLGDVVTGYEPQVSNWMRVENATTAGWISLQNGAVTLEKIGGGTTPPPVTFPGSKAEAIHLRDAYAAVEEGARQIRVLLDTIIARM
jgi:hypothetical protein